MSHNDYAVALANLVGQRVGNNPAAHMAALFHAVGNAAVKLKAVHRLDGGLVAAASQGDINALPGHFLAFKQRLAPVAQPDGDGDHTAGVQGTHLVQDIKTGFDHPAGVALLHHRNIPVVGDLRRKPVVLAK